MRERLRAAAKALRVFAVSVVQIALSRCLLAVRAIVRLLLLSLAMWSIGLPVLGFFWLLHWWPVVSEHLSEPHSSMLMKVAAVALGAGLLSSLLKVGFCRALAGTSRDFRLGLRHFASVLVGRLESFREPRRHLAHGHRHGS